MLPSISSPELSRDTRLGCFIHRQLEHGSVAARREIAVKHKTLIRERQEEDGKKFFGLGGKKGFRDYLITRFGSVLCGFRQLDLDESGKLSHQELCIALRKVGYHGDLKRLWRELDADDDGFVSVKDIDPDVALTVGKFRMSLLNEYGDMLTAWTKGFDTNGSGRIDQGELSACCKHMGLDIDTEKLWDMLRMSPAKDLGLRLYDFDPDAYHRYVKEDYDGLMSSRGNMDLIEDLPGMGTDVPLPKGAMRRGYKAGGLHAWRGVMSQRQQVAAHEARFENERLALGLHTATGFKRALIQRCGSLYGAWRTALDLDGNERITFPEFCYGLQRLGLHGNVKSLWAELLEGTNRGHLLLSDLDPETDKLMSSFRAKVKEVYGNMLLGWLKCIDSSSTGVVDEKQFVNACNKLSFEGDGKRVFKLLQPEAGRTSLSLWDLDMQAYLALTRGDFRMLSEQDEAQQHGGKSKLEMNLNERTETSFQQVLARARALAIRSDYAKAANLADPPQRKNKGSEGFKHLCERRYGSLVGAWQLCLDKDHNGKLSFAEFCESLRYLGYLGDFKKLWDEYDKKGTGCLTLRDLDATSDRLINDFLDVVMQKYGDLHAAWKQGFSKDPGCRVDIHDLRKLCAKLSYPHDVQQLFGCFQPGFGSKTFTLWDIHPIFHRRSREFSKRRQVVPFGDDESDGGNEVVGASAQSGRFLKSGVSLLSLRTAESECLVDTRQLHLDFNRLLEKTYGSTVCAWRHQLDPHTKGFATQGNFRLAVEKVGLGGNTKALWGHLTRGEDKFLFVDLDASSQTALTDLRGKIVEKCGCVTQFWRYTGAPEMGGRLSLAFFKNALADLGTHIGDPAGMFKILYQRLGQISIELEDMEALLIGVPSKEREDLWGRDPVLSLSPVEPSKKEFAERRLKEHYAQDKRITSLDGFKKMLVVKYGSLFAAWRSALDTDQNGVVSQRDFTMACQSLGLKHVKQLWAEADTSGAGQLRIEDLDLVTARSFAELERLLLERYGHTKEGWRRAFGVEKTGLRCGKPAFLAGCKKLGYLGDPAKLFRLLRPCNDRNFLYYEDLWTNLNPNDFSKKDPHLVDCTSPLGSPKHRPPPPQWDEPLPALGSPSQGARPCTGGSSGSPVARNPKFDETQLPKNNAYDEPVGSAEPRYATGAQNELFLASADGSLVNVVAGIKRGSDGNEDGGASAEKRELTNLLRACAGGSPADQRAASKRRSDAAQHALLLGSADGTLASKLGNEDGGASNETKGDSRTNGAEAVQKPPLASAVGSLEVLEDDGGDWLLGRLVGQAAGPRHTRPAAADSGISGVPQANTEALATAVSSGIQLARMVAVYAFDPAALVEWPLDEPPLALAPGQIIEVLHNDGGDWVLGQLVDKPDTRGFFSSAYAQAESVSSAAAAGPIARSASPSARSRVVTLHAFDGAAVSDSWPLEDAPLTLATGQVLEILEDNGGDWLLGRLAGQAGPRGYFPRSHTRPATADEGGLPDWTMPMSGVIGPRALG